jgi:4-hydroxy-4-methyl-2-oxoglutarate aldolase
LPDTLAPPTPEQLATLRSVSTPTIANAIEQLDVRPRGQGFTGPGVRCIYPNSGVMLGYACTALILSGQPAAPKRLVDRTQYWEYTRRAPSPKVTVIQDLSPEPLGAYIGEVNAHIHIALGSVGILTNGTVRDVPEMKATGLHIFARDVSVSHAYAHLEDFNRQVQVFGMDVHPGDLIHADVHGAVVIPHAIASEVAARGRAIEHAEKVIIDLCRGGNFSLAQLDPLVSPEY